MRQKLLSFGDDFLISDADGNDCFVVDGRAFSFGDKLSLLDMDGNEKAFISQRLLSWGPSYEIHRGGQESAIVSKEHFTFFRCKFEVDGPGEEDYEAKGDFLEHEYEIHGNRGVSAVVTKKWLSIADSYGIEISDELDPVLFIAVAVVIDLVCHGGDKH